MKPTCVIGFDGGGTKTAAILADRKGTILAEAAGGPANFQIIGVEKAAEVLYSLLLECCEKAGRPSSEVSSAVAGLTGAGRSVDQERMKQSFSEYVRTKGIAPDYVAIESDARIALEGAFKGLAGIILIAGTGSIAYGKTQEGDIFRVGGWGRIVGDEGGGYAIGREALNLVSKHIDGRGKETILTKLMAEQLGLKDQETIIKAVYRDNIDVASIAPLVIKAAGQHDTESERILNRAAFELTEHIRTLTFKLEGATKALRQKIPLSFVGSLLTEQTLLSKIVKHKIEFSIPQIKVVKAQASPAFGAVLMALHLLED
jgi:N-acetylglucosamine kinase-like BadF-type ATPase